MWYKIKNFHVTPRFVKQYIIFLIVIGLTHHLDHALRYDHSGWPIRPHTHVMGAGYVTPFSYSLLVYPVLLSFLFTKNKAYRILMSIPIIGAVWVTHLTIEPPEHIYHTWSNGVVPDGRFKGYSNLLHLVSPFIGVISLVVLSILAIAVLILPVLIWRERNPQGNIAKKV